MDVAPEPLAFELAGVERERAVVLRGTCMGMVPRPAAGVAGVLSFSCEEETCRKYSHGMLSF